MGTFEGYNLYFPESMKREQVVNYLGPIRKIPKRRYCLQDV